MEKKQLFDSSLVGFHPNTFIPFLELNINIDDYDIYENFTVEKDIALDDNFIDIYNKIEKGDFCSISLNITNNNSDNSTIILSGYRGTTGLYFRDVVILQISNKTTITNLNFANIDTSSKTASIVFIRKVLSQSDSDNTIVRLTTTINGLTNLNPGDFNETVTLTDEEYNAFSEIPIGKIFILVNSDNICYFTIKNSDKSFRANRYHINTSLTDKSLVSFIINLGENNQATFIGNVTRLMDFGNYLAKDNTTEYTPTSDYNPATKKYVDDKDVVAKLRLYNGKVTLQHTAGKSLINDTCESFADFITIFDNMQQLDGTAFTNPFTGMTLPTNVNEFLEAFQSFQSTYNVFDAGHLVHPMIGAHASDENIIIVGFYRHNIGPAEIQFGDVSYLNWQANSVFGIGINSSTGNYVQIDNYQISTLSLDRGLVANLIHKINNLDLSNYIAKNNTAVYTPTGDYNPATKKYVDDKYYHIEKTGQLDLDFTVGGMSYNSSLKYILSLNMSGNIYTTVLEILDSGNNETLANKIIVDNLLNANSIINTIADINTTFAFESPHFDNKLIINYILKSTIKMDFKNKTIDLTVKSTTAKCLSTIVTETKYSEFTNVNDGVLYFVTPD